MKQYRCKYIFLFLSLATCLSLQAEESAGKWTLKKCLDYALENNIQVKKSKITQLSGNEDYLQSKAELFPSLSAGISQGAVFYPSDGATSNKSYTGNYSLTANWTLFDGGSRRTAIKQSEIQNEINRLGVAQDENDIRISIIQTYMQVLYAYESVRINENTVEVSKAQRDRGEQLLAAGSISKADLAQLESQYSTDKHQLVVSQTSLENYKLQLKQLLELNITEEIRLDIPELGDADVMVPLPEKEVIYTTALAVMPEIESSRLNLDKAQLDIRKAKAAYLPSLSLNAGIGTGHLSGTDYSFGTQMWDRFNQSIGLTVSIPIFTNRSNKTALNKAKLAVISQELEQTDTEKQLLKTVEGIYLDATSSQHQYLSSKEQTQSLETSYELIEEQFNLGMKNTLELLTEKNNLKNAQQEVLQSKYMSIMSILLLDLYQNKPIQPEF